MNVIVNIIYIQQLCNMKQPTVLKIGEISHFSSLTSNDRLDCKYKLFFIITLSWKIDLL